MAVRAKCFAGMSGVGDPACSYFPLTPAQAGVQGQRHSRRILPWIPACAGMSGVCVAVRAKCFAGMSGECVVMLAKCFAGMSGVCDPACSYFPLTPAHSRPKDGVLRTPMRGSRAVCC